MALPPSSTSPGLNLIQVSVQIDGRGLPDAFPVASIRIVHEVNMISHAELVLAGPLASDPSAAELPDDVLLLPGGFVTIAAGTGQAGESPLFSGSLVSRSLELAEDGTVRTRLYCKHKAVTMTYGRRDGTGTSDAAVITALAAAYGLPVTVDEAPGQTEALVPRSANDWERMVSLATRNGLLVFLGADDAVRVTRPVLTGPAALNIARGDTMRAFQAIWSAERQPPAISAAGWDIATQRETQVAAAEPVLPDRETVTARSLAATLGQQPETQFIPMPAGAGALQAGVDARLLWRRLCALRGTVSFAGHAGLKTGDLLRLDGVGAAFNGAVYVSGVTHELSDGDWKTTARFGLELPPGEGRPAGDAGAAGQVPAFQGLQIATVTALSGDPKSEGRICVSLLPTGAGVPGDVWAYRSSFYATSGAGAVFPPEIGDTVVVGFLESAPGAAVMLGALHTKADSAGNLLKTLTTKAGLRVALDDEQKEITLSTPGNNAITLSDAAGGVALRDQHGNSILLSPDGITLTAAKDLVLNAGGAVRLHAAQQVGVSATGTVSIQGTNIQAIAQMSFTAKGTAAAELSASGQTVIKGAMVLIN